MKIGLGSDHGGFELKERMKAHLTEKGYEVIDFGSHSGEPIDYPDAAAPVCKAVQAGEVALGMLFCGTGIGISMAANKFKNIRAALCSDVYSAKMAKLHNNAQIICMGGRVTGCDLAFMIADTWLETQFEGGRHSRRIDKIHKLEEN